MKTNKKCNLSIVILVALSLIITIRPCYAYFGENSDSVSTSGAKGAVLTALGAVVGVSALAALIFSGKSNNDSDTKTNNSANANSNTNAPNNLSLTGVIITPIDPQLPCGVKLQLTLTGKFSDNTGAKKTENLTHRATWRSSDTAIATIDSHGLVHGLKPGSTKISATYSGLTAVVKLTVSKATLTSLKIKTTDTKVALGFSRQFTAVGAYSDGTKIDLTRQVLWTSSNMKVANISNIAGAQGLATTLTLGKAIITATMTTHAGEMLSATKVLTVTNAVLVALAITPATAIQAKGRAQQFTATGTMSDQTTEDLTQVVTWTSSDPSIATINAQGNAKVEAASGTVTITATDPNTALSDEVVLTAAATEHQDKEVHHHHQSVNQEASAPRGLATLTATGAALVSIQVTPGSAGVAKGSSKQFIATGTMSDQSTQDLTTQVIWTSSDPSAATIDASGNANALVAGKTVTITATMINADGSITTSNNAILTIGNATVKTINITPASISQYLGWFRQFIANGTMSDNTTQNITNNVTWRSNNTTIATINATGDAAAKAEGTATISASYVNYDGSSAASNNASLNVLAAAIYDVQVTPVTPRIANGTNQSFTATAIMTDGNERILTDNVTWSSDNTTIATIDNISGLATAESVGTVTITATTDVGTVYNDSITGNTSLTVADAVLQAIEVTPVAPSIAQGLSMPFVATGTYSNNATKNITNNVTWSSNNTTIATINASSGIASAQAVGGPVTITATDSSTLVSGNASLSVTNAVLQTINIAPVTPSVAKGLFVPFTVIGTYSDNTTQNLTNVTWNSSNPTIATIDNSGNATGLTLGSTIITATANNSSINDSTSLRVTNATVTTIDILPLNTSAPCCNITVLFNATGKLSDNSAPIDLTNRTTWQSSNTGIATINATGNATTKAVGMVTINAAFANYDGSMALSNTFFTVTPPVITSIAISPLPDNMIAGFNAQFTATGNFSDNISRDVTNNVTWTADNSSIIVFNGSLATAVAAGTTNITATDKANASMKNSTSVTVVADGVVFGDANGKLYLNNITMNNSSVVGNLNTVATGAGGNIYASYKSVNNSTKAFTVNIQKNNISNSTNASWRTYSRYSGNFVSPLAATTATVMVVVGDAIDQIVAYSGADSTYNVQNSSTSPDPVPRSFASAGYNPLITSMTATSVANEPIDFLMTVDFPIAGQIMQWFSGPSYYPVNYTTRNFSGLTSSQNNTIYASDVNSVDNTIWCYTGNNYTWSVSTQSLPATPSDTTVWALASTASASYALRQDLSNLTNLEVVTTNGNGTWKIATQPLNLMSYTNGTPLLMAVSDNDSIYVAAGAGVWRYNSSSTQWSNVYNTTNNTSIITMAIAKP